MEVAISESQTISLKRHPCIRRRCGNAVVRCDRPREKAFDDEDEHPNAEPPPIFRGNGQSNPAPNSKIFLGEDNAREIPSHRRVGQINTGQ
jgi:hypothetical protein